MIGQTYLHGNKGGIRKRLLLTYCWNPNYCCLVAWRGFKNGSQHSKDKSTPQPLFPWVPFFNGTSNSLSVHRGSSQADHWMTVLGTRKRHKTKQTPLKAFAALNIVQTKTKWGLYWAIVTEGEGVSVGQIKKKTVKNLNICLKLFNFSKQSY